MQAKSQDEIDREKHIGENQIRFQLDFINKKNQHKRTLPEGQKEVGDSGALEGK